jgi:hypothetical protein
MPYPVRKADHGSIKRLCRATLGSKSMAGREKPGPKARPSRSGRLNVWEKRPGCQDRPGAGRLALKHRPPAARPPRATTVVPCSIRCARRNRLALVCRFMKGGALCLVCGRLADNVRRRVASQRLAQRCAKAAAQYERAEGGAADDTPQRRFDLAFLALGLLPASHAPPQKRVASLIRLVC